MFSFVPSPPQEQRTDFPDPEVEFLALAMLPGLNGYSSD